MDVTPPLAAGQSSRRTAPPPVPAQPTGTALVLRRVGTAVAGLAVAALAGAACVLSFDALRALAVTGGARSDLSYLYPAGFDALLAIALISVLLLRPARLLLKLQAALVLTLLIVAAAAANVVIATGVTVGVRQATVAVAVVPWVMLVLGLWLFLLPARSGQSRPSAAGVTEHEAADIPEHEATDVHERAVRTDIVPFGHEERDPDLAPPLMTGHAPALERDFAPHLEALYTPEPEIAPVVPPTPAPETPPVDELPPLPRQDRDGEAGEPEPQRVPTRAVPAPRQATSPHETGASHKETGSSREGSGVSPDAGGVPDPEATVPQPGPMSPEPGPISGEPGPMSPEEDHAAQEHAHAAQQEHGVPDQGHGAPEQEHAVPEPEPEQRLVPKPRARTRPSPRPERDPDMPLRWGDLVRPSTGDVLVHPLPKPTRDREPGDTQPYPQITDEPAERPATEVSDGAEDSPAANTQPYPHLREDAAPMPSEARQEAGAGPDPAHDAGCADEEEAPRARRQPYGEAPAAPPSVRMRSTPLPPEE
ncbi:DUF2637 domain-containing protein [Sphaerisporangium sp. NPDC049002]|uniref:DUF2637 domain-containing protein n=1 Tax=unclassified Sphaerisporangium TaxID=2630420 RepID=UPI0033C70260